MFKKSITITAVLASSILAVVAITTPFAYAQSSETETEQEIRQKNVCSGWAICTNEAVNAEDPELATSTGSVLTFP